MKRFYFVATCIIRSFVHFARIFRCIYIQVYMHSTSVGHTIARSQPVPSRERVKNPWEGGGWWARDGAGGF